MCRRAASHTQQYALMPSDHRAWASSSYCRLVILFCTLSLLRLVQTTLAVLVKILPCPLAGDRARNGKEVIVVVTDESDWNKLQSREYEDGKVFNHERYRQYP